MRRALNAFWIRLQNKPRERRLLFYLGLVLAIAAWKFVPRPWYPTVRLETAHYSLESTATPVQTEKVSRVLESLHAAYAEQFSALPAFRPEHPRLKGRLYQNRHEFRRINPGLSWAEAYYRKPYCHAYYSDLEKNPYHWMTHEATHQLNTEVAGLHLEKWLEEGIADYFGTALVSSNGFQLGCIDVDTYPVWWIHELAVSARLEDNLRNGSVIPLRAIVTNSGGPSLSRNVNLYYLHWWTLTYFIFEDARHRTNALALVRAGGTLSAFERLLGPVDRIQEQWHCWVQRLKQELDDDAKVVHR
jgi:hypothetical protein